MKFLITGSRGFIGGSFGRYAARHGHQVTGTGRGAGPSNDWPGQYIQTDLAPTDVAEIVREFAPDVVLHAAGSASVASSQTDPISDWHAAAGTCANVLEGVRRSGLAPLILIPSSAAVFGNPDILPVPEDAPLQPISPYGFHKAVCELLAREYAKCFGLDIIVCRFFSVFGFAQRRLLVWEIYKQLAGAENIAWLEGTGTESRDFLHIDDVNEALLGLSDRRRAADRPGTAMVINVGSGIETTVTAIAEQLRDLVAPQKEIRCRGIVRKNDPLRWCADITRLQSCLPAWQPGSLRERLALCVESWQEHAVLSQHGS